MVITLPMEAVAELAYTLVSQKPDCIDSPERWLTGLRMWRAMLSGAEPQVRAHMGRQIDIFDHALSFIPTLDNRTGQNRPRSGDWGTLENFPDLLEEQQAWLDAGLLPGPTVSSSEWPAVALLHACHQTGTTPGALGYYFKHTYLHDAPSVMKQLVPWAKDVDFVQMMQEPAHGHPTNPPIGLDLFTQKAEQVRSVLLPYLPVEAVDVRDVLGNNAMGRADSQLQVDEMVKAGINPNARNIKGQKVDEVEGVFYARTAARLNGYLKRHRTLEQHQHALHQMTAGMLATSALDDVKKYGDLEGIRTNPIVEWKGQPVGILSYLKLVHTDNRHLKINETIGNMLDLLSGPGLPELLRVEGGARKALALVLSISADKSDQQMFVGHVGTLKKKLDLLIKTHQITFQDIFLDAMMAIEEPHASVFGNFLNQHALGLMESSQQAGEPVDLERWAQLMPRLGESLLATDRTLGALAQRTDAEYDTAGALLSTLDYVLEHAVIPDDDRSTWLQGLLPAAVMARRRMGQAESQNSLLEITVTRWLGELGMPALSEQASAHLDSWMSKVAPDLMAHSRKLHLDNALPGTQTPSKPNAPRL